MSTVRAEARGRAASGGAGAAQGAADPGRRCTADAAHCIALATYIADVCLTIERVADEAGLDAHFFARLLWKESLFDAGAVSPAGAQGIAQFMPATAARRGLADPFNPAEAMRASARYLAELRDLFGNYGLAAAAYNAGEARVQDFLAGARRLPPETRAYVPAITGLTGEEWRDAAPVDPDFALAPGVPFRAACEDKAGNRTLEDFRILRPRGRTAPWAAIVAAHRSRDIAAYRFERLAARHGLLRDARPEYIRTTLPGMPGAQYTVQIGQQSRDDAERFCRRFRADGGSCMVLRN